MLLADGIPVHCSCTEIVDILTVIPNPRNPNQHPPRQIELLAKIIKSQGWRAPITVSNRSGFVVRGHGRLLVAQFLRAGQVPVDRQDYATEAEEWADLIADNRIAELAHIDEGLLASLLSELNASGFNIDLTGFDNDEIDRLIDSLNANLDDKDDRQAPMLSLGERFLVSPFSVLDSRKGEWQERKRAWVATGIKSEESRQGLKSTGSLSGTVPGYYDKKKKCEEKIGRRLSNEEFQQHYLKEYLPSDSIIATTTDGGMLSIFDPVLCEVIYYWFCPKGGKVVDPFAGGSVRGIVASVLGLDYTGIDIREEQIEANRKQGEQLLQDRMPKWIHGDSVNLCSLASGEYDFAFSCPPYADLEVYSDNPSDLSTMNYDDFLRAYNHIIACMVSMLKDNRFTCFVVGDIRDKQGFYRNFVADTIAAFKKAGMELYNEAVLLTALGSLPIRVGQQFSAYRKLGKAHQNVLIFYKGNPKLIKETYGEIQIDHSLFPLNDT